MKEKILIIEDDQKIARFIELELKFEGYDVVIKNDGKEGFLEAKYNHYDLILLDVMLPKMNGFEICKKIREFSDVPIIMLTAKDQITDKIACFGYGADDYITKPFENAELLIRIKAILKRTNKKDEKRENFVFEDLEINYSAYEVYRGGELIELSKKEFELLDYLVLNKDIVLTRDNILETVWGIEHVGNNNILDLYIKYLRDKIDKSHERKYIQTKRGIGFVFK